MISSTRLASIASTFLSLLFVAAGLQAASTPSDQIQTILNESLESATPGSVPKG
jgi:hypothetical protein